MRHVLGTANEKTKKDYSNFEKLFGNNKPKNDRLDVFLLLSSKRIAA
jgi:hypothetical protein